MRRLAWLFPLALAATAGAPAMGGLDLVNSVTTSGAATDLGGGSGANANRLGGFYSDLFFDRRNDAYYGLVDRGPGGGLIGYETRVQKFSIDVDATTGAITSQTLQKTIKFRTSDGSAAFNGLRPDLLNGSPQVLGNSFDPEGIVVARNGNFFVADEYGPSLYEFTPVTNASGETEARFVRALNVPDNLTPREPDGDPNFADGRPIINRGRQDNRGFEGLTISPNGKTLYAVLQDPLLNEGSADGRSSRNVRIVEFDAATGESGRQFIYQLEALADINDRIPGTGQDFAPTAQGRNIGVSAIVAINANEFLVIERDNRGIGVEDPLGNLPVGSKRIYRISLDGASDVSAVDLTGTNDLGGLTPVSKVLFEDIAEELTSAGMLIPEKFEGLAIGPQLANGDFSFLLGTDNDFSVTQTGTGEQFDVFTDGTQAVIDSFPPGKELLPTYLYSLRGDLVGVKLVPEPGTWAMLAVGGAGLAVAARRRIAAR